eukprot:GFUD01010072.1.p1 GENE.GFUD01010072.1~~GFUD01010072.1.p1  ORF type:complete len:236 (+),score=62.19 GFUD01010072.1:228-935(+)
MMELFTDFQFSTDWPAEDLFHETNIDKNVYTETFSDQNSLGSNASSDDEFSPDENLFCYLMDDASESAIFENSTANQAQTSELERIPMEIQHLSGDTPDIFVDSAMELNKAVDYIEHLDLSTLQTFGGNEQAIPMDVLVDKTSSNNNKTDNRHRKGPKPLLKEELVATGKWKNVKRCRDYRSNKKATETVEMTELEKLRAKNSSLKGKELDLKEKVKKAKEIYIKLINEGQIKFC